MATTTERQHLCPKCGTPLDGQMLATGEPVACPHCGAKLQKQPSPKKVTTAGDDEGLLAWVEDLLIKMIRGIFEFILVKVPTEIYRAVLRWFPTLVRLIRVIMLFVIWTVLALGPLALTFNEVLMPIERYLPAWFIEHQVAWQRGIYGYTGLAIVGSCWGIMFIKRRRQRRAMAQQRDRIAA